MRPSLATHCQETDRDCPCPIPVPPSKAGEGATARPSAGHHQCMKAHSAIKIGDRVSAQGRELHEGRRAFLQVWRRLQPEALCWNVLRLGTAGRPIDARRHQPQVWSQRRLGLGSEAALGEPSRVLLFWARRTRMRNRAQRGSEGSGAQPSVAARPVPAVCWDVEQRGASSKASVSWDMSQSRRLPWKQPPMNSLLVRLSLGVQGQGLAPCVMKS